MAVQRHKHNQGWRHMKKVVAEGICFKIGVRAVFSKPRIGQTHCPQTGLIGKHTAYARDEPDTQVVVGKGQTEGHQCHLCQ